MRIFLPMLVLCLSVSGFAQSSTVEIRATGEHKVLTGDTPDSARLSAFADATRKVLQEAVTRLQRVPDIEVLHFKSIQLSALAAAILEIQEQASRAAQVGGTYRVDAMLRLEPVDVARRLRTLRKDQDATNALVEIWKETEELYRRLGGASSAQETQSALTSLRVKHLAAEVSVALAKTEESLVSARVPSAEGRARAKQIAEAARAMAPDSPDAHYAMGDMLADSSQAEAAEAEYRKALSGNPSSSLGHIKLANALLSAGKLPDAIAELREALRIDPMSAAAHTDLGIILAAQNNSSEAIAEYREAIRLDPDFIDAHNNLAIALARQKRLPDAIVQFREIVRIDPDSALAHYNLAIALADMDQDVESAEALREVVRINPNHYNARYNLAELFRLEGKFDEAAKQFREYLRLAPDTPQNQRNIRRAKQLIQNYENQ